MTNEDALKVKALFDRIAPILHGHDPSVQSGVLADLLAMWLAGHVALGDPVATAALRKELLRDHINLVRDLVEPNAEMMGTAELMDVKGGRH